MTPKPEPTRVALVYPAPSVAVECFDWIARAWTAIQIMFDDSRSHDARFWLEDLANESTPDEFRDIRGCGPSTMAEIKAMIQYHLGEECPEAWR